MKLLRCHIDNFGVLSDFDYVFAPNLNIVFEENGFGKTTFAAFIKAMLFGMPKSGARNITDNERKRYNPWQGGNYGGYLEFEYQGTNYRVKRYFGTTASKDTFELTDLTNKKASTRFKENLGDELFQLDAGSFARSTYIPQLAVKDTEATTSIRTKLSNLVDNTNDINNFDTASKSLRTSRTLYKAYRGSGGCIGELDGNVFTLDKKIRDAESNKPDLKNIINEISELESDREKKRDVISSLREKFKKSSLQKSRKQLKEQYNNLKNEIDNNKRHLDKLNEKYPSGLPSAEEIAEQKNNLFEIKSANSHLSELVLSNEDLRITEEGKIIFADAQSVETDINDCNNLYAEINDLTAKMDSPLSSDEQRQLNDLSKQFESELPTEKELIDCLSDADNLYLAQGQLDTLFVSKEDQKQYEELGIIFRNGVPDRGTLNEYDEKIGKRNNLTSAILSLKMTDDELTEYELLRKKFATSVPSEQDIRDQQKNFRQIIGLESKKSAEKPVNQNDSKQIKNSSSSSYICGIVGAVLLLSGIACFLLNHAVPGILLIVSGLIGIIMALWISIHHAVDSKKAFNAIIDAEKQELNDLRESLNSFLLTYYPDTNEPDNKLSLLLRDIDKFNTLKSKEESYQKQTSAISKQIKDIDTELTKAFKSYYPADTFSDNFAKELRDSLTKYESLKEKINGIRESREELSKSVLQYSNQITNVLDRFYQGPYDDLRKYARSLEDDKETYVRLSEKKKSIDEHNDEFSKKVTETSKKIIEILDKYNAHNRDYTLDQCINNLRNRFGLFQISSEKVATYNANYTRETNNRNEAEKSIKRFLDKYHLNGYPVEALINNAESDINDFNSTQSCYSDYSKKLYNLSASNPDIEKLSSEVFEDLPEPDTYITAENNVQEEIDKIDEKLLNYRKSRDQLRKDVEQISSLEDQLQNTKEDLRLSKKKCELLDKTLNFLEQAKDNLAHSYVGKIENRFKDYVESILEDQFDNIEIDNDLIPKIDDMGSLREVGCYSAGLSDCIMLCMRLSLVDALFETESPFLILDDPFVNLDDRHTIRALQILNAISESRQVIYLTCNSSRR